MTGGIDLAPERRVFILDPDADWCATLGAFLSTHGYAVRQCVDSTQLDRDAVTAADLVILEIDLLQEDGFSVLKRLTSKPGSPSVIVLSRLVDVADRIVGLELGADDYLMKPPDLRELLARIRAVLRRPISEGALAAVPGAEPDLMFRDWRLDIRRRRLTAPGGGGVQLSNHELALLAALVATPHRVLTREDLSATLHRTVDRTGRVVDITVSRLRRKMRVVDPNLDLIHTVRRLGYVLSPEGSPAREGS